MNTTPIICNGNALPEVLADIMKRGAFVDRLETGYGGHNAMYRVNYFELGETPDEGTSSKDKRQASENHSGKVATVRGLLPQDAGGARNAMTRKASGVCAEPAALTPFPHQCETPANPAAPEAVKGAVALRDPLNDPKDLVKGRLIGSVEAARCGK